MKLREYQQQAKEEVRAAYVGGAKGVLLVLPTGGGKTIVFAEITRLANAKRTNTIILAHRQELIWQASDKLTEFGIPHGVIMGKRNTAPHEPVQVCSIDTVKNRELPFIPDFIVVDEAHLINSNRYRQFIDRIRAINPNVKILLVTATPFRYDGKGFTEFADVIVVGATITDLISQGYLVPPRVFSGAAPAGLENVRIQANDYKKEDLERVMNTRQIVGDIVSHYKQYASGKKAVCFCVSINHSKSLTEEFKQAGIKAEHLDGKMTDWQRQQVLKRLKTGETTLICNANVLCEGWDEPSIECVILARPTKSEALYIQQAGRGLRICPEIGKTECIILDHGENTLRHGLLTEKRPFSLEGNPKEEFREKKEKEKKEEKICMGCYKPIPVIDMVCGWCGYSFARDEIENVDGNLIEITDNLPEEWTIRRKYANWIKKAKELKTKNGQPYKKAWAFYQMLHAEGYSMDRLKEVLGTREVPFNLREKSSEPAWVRSGAW